MSKRIENTVKIDISPEMSIYNTLKNHSYSLGGALSEYIDNSLQSFIDNEKELKVKKLKITITIHDKDINNKKIVIEDNAGGISHKDLDRAMKPAYKPEKQNLNEFGIGMKAASLWIGRKWTLYNHYLHRENKTESEEIVFDLDDLIQSNETLVPIRSVSSDANKNGVTIIIERLNRDFDKELIEDAFCSLVENYQYFIYRSEQLELNLVSTKYNDLHITPKDEIEIPKVLKSRKMITKGKDSFWDGEEVKEWKQKVNFLFNEKCVTGFVMCREPSAQKNPGLKYFREKRLIQGTSRNWNRPIYLLKTPNKHDSLRFYAELHLDGQAISNNKDKLDINEKKFLDILKAQPGVNEILEQAKDYRPRSTKQADKHEQEGISPKSKNKESQANSTEGSKNNSKSQTKQKKPIDLLDLVIENTENLVTQSIAQEAKNLYGNSDLGFLLCYRAIMEKVIQEKIKGLITNEQFKKSNIADKSINRLITWLNNNKNSLPFEGEWQSVKRNLQHFDKEKVFDVTNIVIHAHYHPTTKDVNSLLINSQKLLEWALSQE